eukprot:CAMPEP_0180115846 /NCGR_PEP_ID=MMETSP0986-20121125/14_1 /TAXON_ID=697907 /ORGANISM="non described non described, Strain CCMP2293" /LENGTH=123 /DNA_ID=CAMNT_0022054503 /DNA_START=1948 /DNA_END=2320 /DNA_ORIENTATION=+
MALVGHSPPKTGDARSDQVRAALAYGEIKVGLRAINSTATAAEELSSRGVSSGEARRQDPGGSSRIGKPDPGQTDVGFESRPLLDGGAAHVDGGVPGVVRRCASESETSERRREGTTLILGGR